MIIDEVDDLAVFGESLVIAWRNSSLRPFFCKAISGSSALSATVASMVSSSSASMRRRRAESALKRAIESSQVDGGAPFEAAGLLPYIEEHIAQQILGHGLVANEAKQPAVDRGAVPGEQDLHGKLVARRDALNQDLVGGNHLPWLQSQALRRRPIAAE